MERLINQLACALFPQPLVICLWGFICFWWLFQNNVCLVSVSVCPLSAGVSGLALVLSVDAAEQ